MLKSPTMLQSRQERLGRGPRKAELVMSSGTHIQLEKQFSVEPAVKKLRHPEILPRLGPPKPAR